MGYDKYTCVLLIYGWCHYFYEVFIIFVFGCPELKPSRVNNIGGEVAGLPMQQNHTECTGVAQHALVLGSSGHVQSDPTVPAQSGDSAIQPDPAQETCKT